MSISVKDVKLSRPEIVHAGNSFWYLIYVSGALTASLKA